MRARIVTTLLWMLAASACTGSVVDGGNDNGEGASANDSTTSQGTVGSNDKASQVYGFSPPRLRNDVAGLDDNVAAPAACDLAISEVAVFQSVKSALWREGKIVEGGTLLVAGKSTLFRVFVSPGPRWSDRVSKARLILTEPGGSIRVFETEKLMSGPSWDGNGASTFNFSIAGSAVNTDTSYQVELDLGPECRRFELSRSVPRQGPLPLGAVGVPPLELVLVPMAYGADGSRRLPDTSQPQLERIKAAMLAMLPLKDVKISVRAAVATDMALDPQTFPMFLDKIRALRAEDRSGAFVHYMGLVMPTATLGEYCKGSCTAGLAFGNMSDDPNLRVGVALGFAGDEAIRTLIHELGHTLGLKHAPCNTHDAVDPAYPYDGGLLGVWGYDERQRRLRDPDAVGDFMGYCSDHWISDYSYNKVLARVRSYGSGVGGQALKVGLPSLAPLTSVWVPRVGPPLRGQAAIAGAFPAATLMVARWHPRGGDPVDVWVRALPVQDGDGSFWLIPTDLPNQTGELFVPQQPSALQFPLR